jgi:hypothetical protein
MQPDRSCWTYAENWDSSKFDDTFEWDECIFPQHQKQRVLKERPAAHEVKTQPVVAANV